MPRGGLDLSAGKIYHNVLGVGANALCVYSMMQDMPIRELVRTRWIEEGWCDEDGRSIRDEASARGSKVVHG